MNNFEMKENKIPTDYKDGYAKAKAIDTDLARKYIANTLIGDPKADAVIEELSNYDSVQKEAWIRIGIEKGANAIPDAPAVVRDFFAEIETVPTWFAEDKVLTGCRAFHRNSEMFIGAFVGAVLIEGFATLISKSFNITGRIVDKGVRRLKQNNRHLVEIFLPGGLERNGDGWKLSVRIRLVHAQVRKLLLKSDEWNMTAWGTPLSASHIAFATASFSGLLLKRAKMLGVKLSDEERESFMLIWRYAGKLMGVEDDLLFKSEEEALRIYDIGLMCEPQPGLESIILSNGLINAAPIIAGITTPGERRKMAKYIYKVSRALIGDKLADQLRYPHANVKHTLKFIKTKNNIEHFLQKNFPIIGRYRRSNQFQTMLNISLYPKEGIRYHIPGHVHSEKDRYL